MALAVLFFLDVQKYLDLVITYALLVIEVFALINCLTQRADAFPVVGNLSKNQWLGILLGAVVVTTMCGLLLPVFLFRIVFLMAAITAAAVYLLDVRPALRDVTNGRGGW
ncbi:MAG: DUF2516 family protein [Micromonosporaceae bacterium]|nr:DUF2516 family protein [Micromonosporaceae bacterium]